MISTNYNIKFFKNLASLFIAAMLFLFWPAVLVEIFPQMPRQVMPSPLNLLPGLIAWLLLLRIRCPYSQMLGFFWLLWYFIGTLNTIASSLILGSYYSNLYLQDATQIYFFGCFFYIFGLQFYEKKFKKELGNIYGLYLPTIKIDAILSIFLLLYPFAWLISIYLTIGYIPIVQNTNIINEMYEIKYGLLYPYGAFIVISAMYASYVAMISVSNRDRMIYGFLAGAFIIISMADGKRAFAMVAVAGILGISFRVLKRLTWTHIMPTFSILVLIFYVGVQLLRVSDISAMDYDSIASFMLIGVEFRDFVYTVNFFSPGEIENYSWGVSTLASMTNNFILELLGFDKTILTNLDSAHAWAGIWESRFGIRTGIISELWFSYGYIAMPVLFLFGLLSGYLVNKLRTLKNARDVIFLAAIFGVLFLSILNQSTFTAGVLPVFLYLYVAIRFWELLISPRKDFGIRNSRNFTFSSKRFFSKRMNKR